MNDWNLKITCLKREIIFQISIFGFHVNFQGCTCLTGNTTFANSTTLKYMNMSCKKREQISLTKHPISQNTHTEFNKVPHFNKKSPTFPVVHMSLLSPWGFWVSRGVLQMEVPMWLQLIPSWSALGLFLLTWAVTPANVTWRSDRLV